MGLGMSAFKGEADGNQRPSERPLIATSGHFAQRKYHSRVGERPGHSGAGFRACHGVLGLHHLADDLILLLRDVKLIEPADDLDLLPVLLVDLGDHLADQ